MINSLKLEQTGQNKFRESRGLYYEELIPGNIIEHHPGRTITLTDNMWQSLINLNPHPIHIDSNYAKNTEFKQILVSSLVTFNIINGMTVNTMSYNAIANLGWHNVKLVNPVFVDDTLYAISEVISRRESKSRPNQGIVTILTKDYNQNQQLVIEFKRTFLVPKHS